MFGSTGSTVDLFVFPAVFSAGSEIFVFLYPHLLEGLGILSLCICHLLSGSGIFSLPMYLSSFSQIWNTYFMYLLAGSGIFISCIF